MISIDLKKAKDLAHAMRRENRAKAFAPLDEMIAKRIPGINLDELEAQRQKIRDEDTSLQNKINSVRTIEKLLEAMK
jgi:hypothetical protein